MAFQIIRNDITKMNTDAIVNAANSSLAPGGGVCGAIFDAAGYEELHKACLAIGHCDVGKAVITPGFALAAKYVIHAVGPIWQGGNQGEEQLLKSCYRSAMELAEQNGCRSVAFPLISSGIYGYPAAQAMKCAMDAIGDYLFDHDLDVTLVIFNKEALTISQKLFADIQCYIDERYIGEKCFMRRRNEAAIHQKQLEEQCFAAPCAATREVAMQPFDSLEDLMDNAAETFSQMLLRLIDEKGISDAEAYKRARIDRRLFSKIRSNKDYTPTKTTVLAFAVALELNLDQARDLLAAAGYAFSPVSKFDLILEYFITNGIYDLFTINETLFHFDQKIFG